MLYSRMFVSRNLTARVYLISGKAISSGKGGVSATNFLSQRMLLGAQSLKFRFFSGKLLQAVPYEGRYRRMHQGRLYSCSVINDIIHGNCDILHIFTVLLERW